MKKNKYWKRMNFNLEMRLWMTVVIIIALSQLILPSNAFLMDSEQNYDSYSDSNPETAHSMNSSERISNQRRMCWLDTSIIYGRHYFTSPKGDAETPTDSRTDITVVLNDNFEPEPDPPVVIAKPMVVRTEQKVKQEEENINKGVQVEQKIQQDDVKVAEIEQKVEQNETNVEKSSNVVNEAKNIDQNTTEQAEPSATEKSAKEMKLSYWEWKQMKLEEEQKKLELEKKKTEEREKRRKKKAVFAKKNFASLACGARVISANPESFGSKNIISSDRDEYMLNRCEDSIWFVVELCESIKAFRLEMANLEIHSSIVNRFRVWMTNFPARDEDWVLFGEFNAQNERSVQTFISKGVFGKFVKVEILSHHGNEYYCTLSLLRLYGIPEFELLGGEEDYDFLIEILVDPNVKFSEIIVHQKSLTRTIFDTVVAMFGRREEKKVAAKEDDDIEMQEVPEVPEVNSSEGIVQRRSIPRIILDSIAAMFGRYEEKKVEEETLKKDQNLPKNSNALQPPKKVENKALSQEFTKSKEKNFANPICGARIVSANPESYGSNHIISSSRDECMLNKCVNSIWFVLELCESIKALKLEIANLELFSSNLNQFRVWVANTPAQDKDWVLFGEFNAKDERIAQTFTSKGVIGKFVKVEILSHHGSERYCSISLFRIYGIPESELVIPENSKDKLEIPRDPVVSSPKHPPSNFFIGIIKDFLGVFRAKDQVSHVDMNHALDSSSLSGNSFKYIPLCPNCDNEKFKETYFLLSSINRELSVALENRPIRLSLEKGICQNLGFNFTKSVTQACYPSNVIRFYEMLFGSSRTIALCNILSVEMNILKLATHNSQWFEIPSENPSENPGENPEPQVTDNKSGDAIESSGAPAILKDEVEKSIEPSSSDPNVLRSDESANGSRDPTQSKSNFTETDSKDAKSATDDDSQGSIANTTSVVSLETASVTSDPTPTANVATNNQRESVWQKLSNKLKALEKNVTLSGEYLEELSISYRKQIEDLQLSTKQTSESLASTKESVLENKKDIVEMRKDIAQLTSVVNEISFKLDIVLYWAYGYHFSFLILQVLIVIFVFYLCFKRTSPVKKNGDPKAIAFEKASIMLEAAKNKSGITISATESPNGSKKQKKNIQQKQNKVANLGRLEPVYHTCQGGQAKRHSKARRKMSFPMQDFKSDSDSSPSEQILVRNGLISTPTVKTKNKFNLLNSSLHDDPTPIKERALDYRPELGEDLSCDEDIGGSKKKKHRSGNKLYQRSKSTSPLRIGVNAKQKAMFKKFNPHKADWIKKNCQKD